MTPPVLRLGLIGHGTVGQSFARHLAAAAQKVEARLHVRVRLARVATRHPDAVRTLLPGIPVTDDGASVALDPSLDLLVEATGADDATSWLTAALARGAGTISANKQAIAASPALLTALADRHPHFHCEAAVAAAIPIVRTLSDSLQGEEILDLRGLLNGTSTFVLSEVERGAEWQDALLRAQSLGLAERGSTADFDGRDAAAKLAILATIAWRTPLTIERVHTRGLQAADIDAARKAFTQGQRLRLLAEASWVNGPRLVVEPCVLEANDPLAGVGGVTNGIELTAALAGQLRWFGPGAGGDRTASALLSDVMFAARALLAPPSGRVAA